jgi:mRNA-degrading endonuclease RelE of RelBE toxin-antitoxin system
MSADRDLQDIAIQAQRKIFSEIQSRLKAERFREIKTRIKRLTGIVPPLYRLRIRDYLAYYWIVNDCVVVLAILHKKDSERSAPPFLTAAPGRCDYRYREGTHRRTTMKTEYDKSADGLYISMQ